MHRNLYIFQLNEICVSDFLSNGTILSNTQDCSLLLRVFTHLFSWVPAAHVPNAVIGILFKLGSKTDVSYLSLKWQYADSLNNVLTNT